MTFSDFPWPHLNWELFMVKMLIKFDLTQGYLIQNVLIKMTMNKELNFWIVYYGLLIIMCYKIRK